MMDTLPPMMVTTSAPYLIARPTLPDAKQNGQYAGHWKAWTSKALGPDGMPAKRCTPKPISSYHLFQKFLMCGSPVLRHTTGGGGGGGEDGGGGGGEGNGGGGGETGGFGGRGGDDGGKCGGRGGLPGGTGEEGGNGGGGAHRAESPAKRRLLPEH